VLTEGARIVYRGRQGARGRRVGQGCSRGSNRSNCVVHSPSEQAEQSDSVRTELNEVRCTNGDSLDDYLVLRLCDKIVV
jgi:hypothetical protein